MMKKIQILLMIVGVFSMVSCGDTCTGNFHNSHAKLCWSDISPKQMNRNDAIKYCENLGGRLPTIKELRSIIKHCPQNEYPMPVGQNTWCTVVEGPDNGYFGEWCSGCSNGGAYSVFGDRVWMWSSSIGSVGSKWSVNFDNGGVYDRTESYSYSVRCVK